MNEQSIEEKIISQCKCGICQGSLENSTLNMVETDWYAPWPFFIANNLLAPGPNRAIAIVCNNCITPEGHLKAPIKFVIKSEKGNVLESVSIENLLKIKNNLILFTGMPVEGTPECICSFCAKPINSTQTIYIHGDAQQTFQFHPECYEPARNSRQRFRMLEREVRMQRQSTNN